MANITLGGEPCKTSGEIAKVGDSFPDFLFTTSKLEDVQLSAFSGVRVLNVFPSIETEICAASVRMFNQIATKNPDVTVLNISLDLPFTHAKFRVNEGIDRAENLSVFRSTFPAESGMRIVGSAFDGLLARVVVVLDPAGKVVHSELVAEIGDEPNYDAALASL